MTTTQAALDHVRESVQNQQQSLSCLSLASQLGISTTSARKVLEEFRESQEKAGVTLRSLYAISGKLKNSTQAGCAIAVVAREKVEESMAKFENACSEIYSVSPPDVTKTADIKGTMSDVWTSDLSQATDEITQAVKQQGIWRPSHLPPSYCTPSATEKRELLIVGYKGGKPIPSPMVQKPNVCKPAGSAVGKPAPKPKEPPTPMPDVSKVKITETPAVGEKRKAETALADEPQATKTKTSMQGGYLVMEDTPAAATETAKPAEAAAPAQAPAPETAPAAAPKKKGTKQMSMKDFFKKKK